MNNIALLILALIAGFLFYQLRSVLGQTPYDAKERNKKRQESRPSADYLKEVKPNDTIVEQPISMTTNHKFIKGTTKKKEEITNTLNQIKDNYKEFQLLDFIDGSKTAYNMIISSFEKDSLNDIADYVSSDILNEFKELRQNYNDKNYKYTNAITSIESAIIENAVINNKTAQITVEIKSQNVISLEDADGNILHGDPKQIKTVTDVWTFERPFTSSSPAWVLISK